MITIYFDGLCEPTNPGGYACWAYVASDDTQEQGLNYGVLGVGEGMTNNVAEYHALLNALQRAKAEGWTGCLVRGDSKLVVNQVMGWWNCNSPALRPLMIQCRQLVSDLSATLEWVPREQNERADHLSNVAYKQARRS